MSPALWLSLAGVCLLGAMSPGPSLAVIIGSTLGGGRGAGLRAALAHGAGVGLYGLLTVAGLAALVTRSPVLFLTLQVAGALYLFYLGMSALGLGVPAGDGPRPRGTGEAAQPGSDGGSPALRGFLVAFLNPKLAVFMLALFSQFLQPGFGTLEKLLMAGTAGAIDALWYSLVALLVSRRRFLERLRASTGTIDRLFGILLVTLAAAVLVRIVA